MQRTRAIVAIGLVLIGFGLVGTETALAQEHGAGPAATPIFGDPGLKGIGASFGAALVIIGGAAGIGRIGASAVESMARQPEAVGAINTATLITAAMIEGATLFAVVVCLLTIIL